MAVISDDIASFPAITDISDTDSQKVQVSTRVPSGMFSYNDGSIDIVGTVTLMFNSAVGGGRKLTVDMDRILQANEEETADFDVTVTLKSEPELAPEGVDAMMNSALATSGKFLTIVGMVFASAFALW